MTTRRYGLGAIALTCLGLFIALFAGEPLLAQRFENAHGNACTQEGYGGRRISTGGYISVGVTHPPDATGVCASASNIYVVKLNTNGTVQWMYQYDIGGSDVGNDVIELTNGDFAICGYTNNRGSGCWPTTANPVVDAFIMRIRPNGAVVWCCTYGDTARFDVFRRIIQCQFGQPPTVGGALVGDLSAAGSTYTGITPASSDGFAVRVRQSNGAVVWSNRYAGRSYDDFRSLIETQVPLVSSTVPTAGNFVMVGQSNSFNTAGVANAFIVRCDGNTGRISTAAPQGVAAYGNGVASYLWSVEEITIGGDSSSLVYTGGIIPSNLTAPDIYLLKTRANPCSYVRDRRIGDNGASADEGSTIRELRTIFSSTCLSTGNLYVTGHSHIRPGYNGDVFAMIINSTNLTLSGSFHLYGELSDDQGWYIDFVPAVSGQSTEGFYITGRGAYAGSVPSVAIPPDPDQMYVLKTDCRLNTNCCDTIYSVVDSVPQLPDSCARLSVSAYAVRCSVAVRRDTERVWRIICNDSLHVHTCDSVPSTGSSAPGRNDGDLSDNGTSAVDPDAPVLNAGALAVNFFPNPVSRGDVLSLRCDIGSPGMVVTSVTDLSGSEIYRYEEEEHAGSNLVRLRTDDWHVGTYLVKVSKGGASLTRRVVVVDTQR